MTTRAIQVDFLLTGVVNPNTNSPVSGGTVYFYEAGTSTPKNVWTEIEKTNPYTSYALGSDGTLQIYGDGVYKLVVKDSAGVTLYTWDDIVIQATTFTLLTKTTNYTVTPDIDWVLCDTDGGAITLSFQTAANYNRAITIKNIGSSGNDVTVDPYSTETVDGASTATIADSNVQTYATDGTAWYSAGTHASMHERAGADEIDGDHLDIDFSPSNYVPATTPAEAANVDDLAAHLQGIDDFLGTDHTTLLAHHARHERAGSDEIDGDHLDIDFTPTRYSPATTPAEAANVDDLTAHLYGIDQAIIAAQDESITTHSGDSSLSASDLRAGAVHSNSGASGAVNLTLPTGADGMSGTFLVKVAQYFKLTATNSETFRYIDGTSAANGYIRSNTVGTVWKILWNGTAWLIVNLQGQLSVDE